MTEIPIFMKKVKKYNFYNFFFNLKKFKFQHKFLDVIRKVCLKYREENFAQE